ncbi:MAG TPA: hypothetical protein VLC53_09180, partial [Myxococcota bacterium]|nr:hypothetical protein [Myxococcota bacterium]
GLLDAVLGDAAAALEQLEEAQRLHERMGTRPWLAITSVDQAEILLLRGEAGDRDHAEQHLREAEEPARALGMQALLGRIEALAGRRDSAFRRRSRNARGRAS